MEAGFATLAIIAAFVMGAIFGSIMGWRKKLTRESSGIIYVDCRDPDLNPEMFLEADVPMDIIATRKYLLFDVKVLR